eukprot:gene30186-64582_t
MCSISPLPLRRIAHPTQSSAALAAAIRVHARTQPPAIAVSSRN